MGFNRQLFLKTLQDGLKEWELALPESATVQMSLFAEMIVEANKIMNLTRLVEEKEMAVKNFLDSLSCLLVGLPVRLQCLDLGTGAGFPGMPLALARPGWNVVLLDSTRKRLNFVQRAIKGLGLSNAVVYHARAEQAGRSPERRNSFDLVVSRAVAGLPALLELSIPLVKVGGLFIAFKGSDAREELAQSAEAIRELKVEVEKSLHLALPLEMGERNLLVFRKINSTPAKYPRRPGIPQKRPLE